MHAVCDIIGIKSLTTPAKNMAAKFERRVRETVSPHEAEHINFHDRSFAAACVYMTARQNKISVSSKDIVAAAGCQAAKFESACNLMREICAGQFRRVHRSDRVTNRHVPARHCTAASSSCPPQCAG